MAAFIPAAVGIGTQIAGAIAGLAGRGKANALLRQRAEGKGLAANAAAQTAANAFMSQARAARTTNPLAAQRNAALMGQEAFQRAGSAAASEQAAAQRALAGNERSDANLLMSILGGAGNALAGGAASMLGTAPSAAPAGAVTAPLASTNPGAGPPPVQVSPVMSGLGGAQQGAQAQALTQQNVNPLGQIIGGGGGINLMTLLRGIGR